MSATTTRIPSAQATELARRFIDRIEPWCVSGSGASTMTAHYRTMMQRGTWTPEMAALRPIVQPPVDSGFGINGGRTCARCGTPRKYHAHCRVCRDRKTGRPSRVQQ